MLQEIQKILQFMVEAYLYAWPYLLITIPLAVAVNVSGISSYINKAFSAKPITAILLATAVGAFSPFCSCGVIPVITALLIGGVPLAPVMSFWLASPSMDPEVFFLSVSQLGYPLAVWRLAGTFVMSLGGGYITHLLVSSGWLSTDVLRSSKKEQKLAMAGAGSCESASCSEPAVQSTSCCSTATEMAPSDSQGSCSDGSCSTGSCGTSDTKEKGDWKKKLLPETRRALIMIVKYMSLAFFLEALIILYIPQEWIVNLLGSGNRFAVPLSAFVSVPLYTTNLTALGLMGGLLEQGMTGGAVLSFLIGGATTTVPAMAAVYGIVKKRVFALYVSFALGTALLTGWLYQLIV